MFTHSFLVIWHTNSGLVYVFFMPLFFSFIRILIPVAFYILIFIWKILSFFANSVFAEFLGEWIELNECKFSLFVWWNSFLPLQGYFKFSSQSWRSWEQHKVTSKIFSPNQNYHFQIIKLILFNHVWNPSIIKENCYFFL